MLLSVIIVTKNPGTDLILTLASLLPLNQPDVEIILKDNSDEEDLSEVNTLYNFKNFSFIHSHDEGIYDAMNQALKTARGKYIYFINAGDQYIDIDLPEILVNADDNIGFFYADVIVLHPRTKFIRFSKYVNKYLVYLKHLNHQGIIFNKSIFQVVGFYDTDLKVVSDFLLILRMSKHFRGKKIQKFLSIYKGAGVSYQYRLTEGEKKLLKSRLKEIFNPAERFILLILTLMIKFVLFIKNSLK